MERITVMLLALYLTTTAHADSKGKLTAKDTAAIDRMFASLEQLIVRVYAARGNCMRLTEALMATTESDNKAVAAVAPLMNGPSAEALQEYSKTKYRTKMYDLEDKFKRGTLYCHNETAFVIAWKANDLATGMMGELAPETARKRKAPVPADYEANLATYDVALEAYLVIGDKFDNIDNEKDCTARAKLIPAFAAAHKKQHVEFEALDKKMQSAVVEDDPRMFRQSSPYITFMNARSKCAKNKAFKKAAKAAKLDGSK